MSTQRRDFYRGEIRIIERVLQDSLNAWILRHIIRIEGLS